MRRRFLLAAARARLMARREVTHALRNGPMPGKNLRAGNAVSFQVESGFRSPARFPGARRTLGCTAAVDPRSDRRNSMNWKGVMPAITTPFNENLSVDHGFLGEHSRWLLENGCSGIVALGSLGEGATLSFDEKTNILRTLGKAVNGGGSLVASISSLTTSESVSLAKAAKDLGCSGLMVLPPYVYLGDWREMKAHVAAVFRATPIACMLYKNPGAYGTEFLPEQISELAEGPEDFQAVKEGSTEAGRVSALPGLVDRRLEISVGTYDAALEAIGV